MVVFFSSQSCDSTGGYIPFLHGSGDLLKALESFFVAGLQFQRHGFRLLENWDLLKLVGKNETHSPKLGGLKVISDGLIVPKWFPMEEKQTLHLKQNKKKEYTGLLFDWILDPYFHIPWNKPKSYNWVTVVQYFIPYIYIYSKQPALFFQGWKGLAGLTKEPSRDGTLITEKHGHEVASL